ncbi:hypothetical protein L6R52_16835, partial [Myxococcota bacterium]|nr:hypothetical protein [Myxococcota bacterium]
SRPADAPRPAEVRSAPDARPALDARPAQSASAEPERAGQLIGRGPARATSDATPAFVTRGKLREARRGHALPGFTPVDVRALIKPVAKGALAPTETIARGQRVELAINGEQVTGTLQGFDFRGRAVVTSDDGAKRIGSYDGLRTIGPDVAVKSPVAGLPANALSRPPEKLAKALVAAFDTEVAGEHSAREYLDALHAEGYSVYLTGGAIRDAIRLYTTKPDATVAEIAETLKDVDVVTTAPPPVVRRIAAKIAPEYAEGAVWSPPVVDQFGTVLIGGPKAGLPNPEGLDVNTIRSQGAFEAPVVHPDTGESANPYVFDRSLLEDAGTRDFACNALYYDPLNGMLVDPTGRGVAEAAQNKLSISRWESLEKDDNIALRFFKFRMRGYDADPQMRRTITAQANHVIWPMGRRRLMLNVCRIAPKSASTAEDVTKFLGQLRDVMKAEGLQRMFDKRIAPLTDQIIERITSRFEAKA